MAEYFFAAFAAVCTLTILGLAAGAVINFYGSEERTETKIQECYEKCYEQEKNVVICDSHCYKLHSDCSY